MKASIFAVALLVPPLAACDRSDKADNATALHSPAEAANDVAAVKQVEGEMLAAMQARDVDAAMSHYDREATVVIPGAPPASGHAAIEHRLRSDLDDKAFSISFTNAKTDVSAAGDLAYARGTFRVTVTNRGTSKVEKIDGTYLTVFRKAADGRWKLVEDFSTPGPAGG